MVVRTWLHRLSWLQVLRPPGLTPSADDVEKVRDSYQQSCLRLADHYVKCQPESLHRLAVPYYRMSKLPPLSVLDRTDLSSGPPAGLIHYIREIVMSPSPQENITDPAV